MQSGRLIRKYRRRRAEQLFCKPAMSRDFYRQLLSEKIVLFIW